MCDHPLRQEGTVREGFDQARACTAFFGEQGEIGRTTRDRVQQPHHAQRGGFGISQGTHLGQQARHRTFEAFTRPAVEATYAQAAHQAVQGFTHCWRPAAERILRAGLELVGDMQALGPRRRFQRACKQIGHPGAFHIQRRKHGRDIGEAHRGGDAQSCQRILRQAVRLFVAQHLHAVFGTPQEQVGAAQPLRCLRIEMTELLRRGKRIEQSRRAQFRLATGTDQLQQLHGEFDFADAAGAKLQVLLAFAPLDFGIDARLQLAQAFDGGEVEVFAIHEGTQAGDQFGTGDTIAGNASRLGPGVAFPVATFALVVLLHRRERQRHATGAAERPQAIVDTQHEPRGRDFRQQLRQPLADTGMEFLGADRTCTVGLAVLGKRENQIDVGRKVQLAATELAHADHAHACDGTVGAAQPAVPRRLLQFDMAQRAFDAVFGEPGGAFEGRQRRVVVAEIVDQNAQAHRPPVSAQGFGEIFAALVAGGIGQRRRLFRDHVIEKLPRRTQGCFDQPVAGEQGAIAARGRPRWWRPERTLFGKATGQFVMTLAEEVAQFGGEACIDHRRILARQKYKARRDLGSRRAALPFGQLAGAART